MPRNNREVSDDACGDVELSQARGLNWALAKVEGANGSNDDTPDYEVRPIESTGNVLVTLPAGRTFQLLGNPSEEAIRCAVAGFRAGLDHGEKRGLRKAWNMVEGLEDQIREEIGE
jgi:hypothetical protein